MHSLPAWPKYSKKLFLHELHYSSTPLLHYIYLCHYATLWNGQTYVVRIVYNRYVILKHCPIDLNIRKYVPCACFKYMTKWTTKGASHISEQWLLR